MSTILVADDDPDILNIVASLLEIAGYTVQRAAHGLAAADFIAAGLPDLAVLDLSMPGMGGQQLCSLIKSREDGQFVPVMILTARDGVQNKVEALDGGADEYMTKPFNHTELLARVRALLRVRQLNLVLAQKNRELAAMQQKLLEQERALAVTQIAGTAAHKLGQPLAALLLNLHLLKSLPPNDAGFVRARDAIEQDCRRMAELIEQLKSADSKKVEGYYSGSEIITLSEKPT